MKILLAVDNSENALRAGQYVVKLAATGIPLEVTVFSVIPFTVDMANYLGIDHEEYYKLVGEKTRPVFHRYEVLFEGIKNLRAEYVTAQGDIGETIVKKSVEENYDEIVIGSRGMSEIKEIFLGSVSHKVVQLAKCPVVIVK
ncbi:UspA domain-containing protein [Desulfotomaculum nigrificans CO-1-SRB]|uniref:UspA domain-containing protein n=1 Tax=Desulfotomaculum nigrificans (strain DSM 14880 / VKM B-2319 / CO-1-SRB) TaxID=868595 RepID=F6B6F2_DESCC|nr:universal stress protein [Desulfotomaculum nigrificans]AEF93223.1 UspA domain-containing protein [Desulfotomaculum nigrificans CO-1-SRB]